MISTHKTIFCTIALSLLANSIALRNSTESNKPTSSFNETTSFHGVDSEAPLDGGCDFDVDFCNWRNETGGDDFDWTRLGTRTPSSNTGPRKDRSGDGSFVYTEASWPRKAGETARLVGGPFSGIMCMRFFYHMYGRHIADLQIYLREDGLENFIWGRFKNQGNTWRYSNVTVFGSNYTIIFAARVGKSYQGDIALDEISFVNGTCDGKKLNYVPRARNTTMPLDKKRGETGTCDFDGGFCEWINLPLGDEFDWTLNSGTTPTMNTGPEEDHTGYDGAYIFIEGSDPQRPRDRALLMGPRICGRMCLQFFYSMNGHRMGKLNVYKREGVRSDDLLWTMSGDQGTDWHEALVDIGGACYQIILEGIVGPSYLSDLAVDDIFFSKGTCCQLKQDSFDAGLIGNCTFDEGFCEWTNDPNDDFDWQLIEGGTPSEQTGPTAGYGGEGQYLYVESSEPRRVGDRAILFSGLLKGLQCMRFRYYMFGQDMGSLSVYRFGDGVMKGRLWRRYGNQGDKWHEARITLPCNATSYMIQIEAVIGVWRSDMAIDKIEFTKGACPPFQRTTTAATTTLKSTTPTLPANLLVENNCSFSGHFCSWINDNNDDFDWLINKGETMTRNTGPASDADGDGWYIYLEASLQRSGEKAKLVSGYMTGTQCVQFKYHMMGSGIGTLRIYQMKRKGSTPRVVWYRVGDQGEDWNNARFNLFGKFYMIFIEGERGPTFEGDIAVDSITFTPGRCVVRVSKEEIQADSHVGEGVCSFDAGFCLWRNEASQDQFDWSITEGETPSVGTGPLTGFGGSGKYAFIESSSPRRAGDKAMLKIYGSGEDGCLFFAYHMSGRDIDSLSVYKQELRKGILPALLWTENGNQGDDWRKVEIGIKGGSQYKLIIEAVRGRSFRGDIAIDDVGFKKGFCGKPLQAVKAAKKKS
ncbi:MAM and LDL-receptor class A domain-containing protein 1-like [Stylophora pistillata]|nr:MAM and LDL-receptor class A domain-containing protein 1-like [Stylophora pistillata]XP_022800393.1 MAM and LDL-receptor class A domain-containing protein 1-like [Stylophora pistillata]